MTVPLDGNIVAIIGGAKFALADSVLETIVSVRAAPTSRDTNLRIFEFSVNMFFVCPSKLDSVSREISLHVQ